MASPTASTTVSPVTSLTISVVSQGGAGSRPLVGPAQAVSSAKKKTHPKRPAVNIVCVWTSAAAKGKAAKVFSQGASVYVIAAWHVPSIRHLNRYHLRIEWWVYRVYQRDVSLVPLSRWRIADFKAGDPSHLKPGTYRLVKVPRLKKARRGWYSVVARDLLFGPRCPRSGCTAEMRQNRFRVKR